MKNSLRLIAEKLKAVLVELAISGDLDLDLTQLDVEFYVEEITQLDEVRRAMEIENLSHYISGDEEEVETAWEILTHLDESTHKDPALWHGIPVWEQLENISVEGLIDLMKV